MQRYANMDLVSQIVQLIQKKQLMADTKKTKDQLHFYKFRDLFKYEFVQSDVLVLSKRSSWKLPQKHLYFAHFVFEIFSGMLTSFQLIQSSKSSRLVKNCFCFFVIFSRASWRYLCPPQRQVRRYLAEGKVKSYEQGELVVKLLEKVSDCRWLWRS